MPRPLHRLAWRAAHAAALLLLGASGWSLRAAAPAAEVRQQNGTFAPGALTIRAGATVAFLNDDRLAHNVYSQTAGHAFDLGLALPGESVEHEFARPGVVDIRCAVHPRMRLAVTVQP